MSRSVSRPPYRRLRVFAFDPSLERSLATSDLNQITLQVPWETEARTGKDLLRPGPVGEYLEVVDVDPASGMFYPPVDLDDPYVLAQDGLAPSVGMPQFHQQMVYAVAMSTIRRFEGALGRRVMWSPHRYRDEDGGYHTDPIRRLRIYPHALREANAYYSPARKALLFGYFPASPLDPGSMLPGGLVFTCLSHDVIVHETTHAILDGMHRRFLEPSNPDVLALHEAFADIVALFQHFSHEEVLRHQISRTRGDLTRQSLLGELAQEFGQAIGRYGSLRDALGGPDDDTGEWRSREPDPTEIAWTLEPHARGAILVAAVFEAFLTIYRARIADLLRIATGGSGVLPPGELHPDLVGRLAQEAAKSATHVLNMCIRAWDYCPPVDVTFGDYLRALITADRDLYPADPRNYRPAVIEAFRRRAIYPEDVRTLSEESLRWKSPDEEDRKAFADAFSQREKLRRLCPDWGLDADRARIFRRARRSRAALHKWLAKPPLAPVLSAAGLTLDPEAPPSIYRKDGAPTLEVHSVRPSFRVGPGGRTRTDMVIELTQRRRGYLDRQEQEKIDSGGRKRVPEPDFTFRGGCTLLVDLETGKVRYSIGKGIESQRRLERQRAYLDRVISPSLRMTYFGDDRPRLTRGLDGDYPQEPFAMLHRDTPRGQ